MGSWSKVSSSRFLKTILLKILPTVILKSIYRPIACSIFLYFSVSLLPALVVVRSVGSQTFASDGGSMPLPDYQDDIFKIPKIYSNPPNQWSDRRLVQRSWSWARWDYPTPHWAWRSSRRPSGCQNRAPASCGHRLRLDCCSTCPWRMCTRGGRLWEYYGNLTSRRLFRNLQTGVGTIPDESVNLLICLTLVARV